MAAMKILVALALAGTASAVCPNACSGHGTCGADDVCQCYQNWGMADEKSGDCSEMYCPFEYAWVDAPDMDGNFHKYAECSGKGICDRSTGECECFDGYTGKGCQRMTCPNDCSGHGTCEYIEELPFGVVPGTYQSEKYLHTITNPGYGTALFKTPFTFGGDMDEIWDYHKAMACVCDPGYIELDCSRRMCPKANDVMDERLNTADIFKYQIQNITFYSAGISGNGSYSTISEFYERSFALTFVSTLNESFTTVPIHIKEETGGITDTEIAMGNKVELALQGLPNKVITNVNVNVSFGYETRYATADTEYENAVSMIDLAYMHMDVEFVGDSVMGPQNLIIPETDKCADGCTPQITGLDLMSTTMSGGTTTDLSFVAEKQAADYNNYECGRRGKCDYDSGICECFEGYTGEACSTQTALV